MQPTHRYATLPVLASLVLAASAVAAIPQNSMADDGTQSVQSGAESLPAAARSAADDADGIQAFADEAGNVQVVVDADAQPIEEQAAPVEEAPSEDASDAAQGEEAPADEPQSADEAQSEAQSTDSAQSTPATPGRTAFRLAGDGTVFGSGANTCQPGEVLELSSHGEIRRYFNGELTTTYDIPIGTFKWEHCFVESATNRCNPQNSVFNSQGAGWFPTVSHTDAHGQVDGFARVRKTGEMFAVQQNGDGVKNDGVLIHHYTDGNWYAVNQNRTETINQWPAGANVPPPGAPDRRTNKPLANNPVVTYTPSVQYSPNGTYTFNNANTAFTWGTSLIDGTYIFGGSSGSGSGKLFARRPNGEIVYLGYFSLGTFGSSTGDIVADKNGNLYIGYGQVVNGRNADLQVTIRKISAADIYARLSNPAARWNGYSWVTPQGGAFSHTDNNGVGTSTGANRSAIVNTTQATMTISGPQTPRPERMSGLDIAPNGNVIVSFNATTYSGVQAGQYNFIAEFNQNGQKTSGTDFNNGTIRQVPLWDLGNNVSGDSRGAPAGLNKVVTDMTGCPGRPPMRKITFTKTLDRRVNSSDQFRFDVSINQGQRTMTGATSGTNTGDIPIYMTDSGDGNRPNLRSRNILAGAILHMEEAGANNSTDLTKYTQKIQCFDEDSRTPGRAFYDSDNDGPTMEIPFPSPDYPNVSDPATNWRGNGIHCKFVNTAKVQVDFLLTKRDAFNNALMENVPFVLYKDNGTGNAHDPNQKVPTQPSGNVTEPTTNVGGQIVWSKVDPGVYWLVEGNVTGYQTLQPQKVVLESNQQSKSLNLTNTRKPGTLTIEKVSNGDRNRLAGSKWRLRKVSPTTDPVYDKTITDFAGNGAAPSNFNDANNAAGMIQVNDLPWGTYILTEEEAPVGFERSTNQWRFTIGATSLTQSYTGRNAIVNNQYTGPAIPFTGGLDRDSFIIGGLVLLGGAAGVSLAFRRKRRPVPTEN